MLNLTNKGRLSSKDLFRVPPNSPPPLRWPSGHMAVAFINIFLNWLPFVLLMRDACYVFVFVCHVFVAPSFYVFILFPYITICLHVHKVSCKLKENYKKYIIYNLLLERWQGLPSTSLILTFRKGQKKETPFNVLYS